MKTFIKALALGIAPVTAIALTAAPAAAQSKQGIAVVDLQRAVATSAAYSTARTQIQTTYKAQIDSFTARKTAIDTDLKTKGDALQAALKAAGGSRSRPRRPSCSAWVSRSRSPTPMSRNRSPPSCRTR